MGKAKEAHDEFDEKKKRRKVVAKRAVYFATLVMKEDNSDLESEEEADQNVEERENSGEGRGEDERTCKVCFEEYGEGDRQEAAIFPCGHKSCFQCLSSPDVKTCPTCRADF